MSPVVLPRAEQPSVSVIVVTYGNWDLVRQTLEAFRDHTEPIYEAIVVDNASPDGTGTRVREEVEGAAVILNHHNAGFGPAVNQAASLASGRYLLLLNPDARVLPGWLPPLIEALESDPRAAAVVPRLLNLDGTLQEAGSLLWSDGSSHALGRGADPEDPAYRFRRYTDYGSAACLLIRRAAFLEAGGFDPAFIPAYCEDVDLSLALGVRGFRVVFEPRSQVLHVRYATTGEEGAARLIERNRELLRDRWGPLLLDRVPPWDPDHPHRVVAARDADVPDRVLVVGEPLPATLALELAAGIPGALVTAAAVGGSGSEEVVALGAEGIETAWLPHPSETWFRDRMFHYSAAVLVGSAAGAAVFPAVRSTQPQAFLAYDPGGGHSPGGASVTRAVEADLIRAAGLVTCRTEADRVFAAGLCSGQVRLVSQGDLASVLVTELAAAGFVATIPEEPLPVP